MDSKYYGQKTKCLNIIWNDDTFQEIEADKRLAEKIQKPVGSPKKESKVQQIIFYF